MAGWQIRSVDGREVTIDVADEDGSRRVTVGVPTTEQLRFDVRAAEQLRAALGAAISLAQDGRR